RQIRHEFADQLAALANLHTEPAAGGWRTGTSGTRQVAKMPADILSRGEVSEWLMVPLSKSGVRKHRGFESHPLRHAPRELGSDSVGTGSGARRAAPGPREPSSRLRRSRRGRLVDYGAALEMRFAATRRGFESLPLRHSPVVDRPAARRRIFDRP